jgi:tetratricopeptide (TPR) repeat protein
MSETSKCNRCDATLPPDAPEGLCPRCLIAANLATQTEFTGESGSAKPPPLPVGDVANLFPQLEILECLGRGGMGAVYQARQPRLDRFVALKILSPERQGNPKFADRFEREARALAKLHHPNIVSVYDFGEAHGNFYLLMEFVDGLTLRQLLQDRRLSPAEALAIVPKICEALQYAHGQGIVHRDIKPENILMDKEGRVKIADFGIAKILGEGARGNLTEEQAIGTPHYMSPEQIEKPQTVDHRADIYSLGVVFYEMLTGELPLGKFQPPSKKVHVDVRLDEIVLRALEKEPERRYQQVSEVKTQVETVAATPGANQHSEAQTTKPETQRLESPLKKSGLVRIVEISFDLTFKSRFAIVLLNASALGFLGCLGFLGYLPGMHSCFGFFGFTGFFGLIGAAFLVELFAGPRPSNVAKSFLPGLSIAGCAALTVLAVYFSLFHDRHQINSDFIGQTWFPLGDSIEIISVTRSTGQIAVKGHYSLVSRDHASLELHVTNSKPSGLPENPEQSMQISKGTGDFELMDNHVVPGLPHVSMYVDGQTFASVYFGTKDEALAEGKATWITNSAAASIETWSPTLAPGEKPDLQTILNSAGSLMNEGSYEEALQRYLWYFDHSRYDADQKGVRITSAISGWIELGRRYPKARQALIEIRDTHVRQFSETGGYADLFQEIAGINQYLGDDDTTVALFKSIQKRDPQLAGECFWYAEGTLFQKGDYQTCRRYLGEPQAAFERIRQSWQRMKQFEKQNDVRREEQRERFQALAKTNKMFAHVPDFPAPPPFADDNFVRQTRELIEVLIATGGKSAAENIQTEALAVLTDSRLKTAVVDAETKLSGQSQTEQTANSLSVLTNTNHPRVVFVWPPDGATRVDNRQDMRIRFSQPMEPANFEIVWYSGGFLTHGQFRYDSISNEFIFPMQFLPGSTNKLRIGLAGEGFRGTNGNPADEFTWQFTTKPFVGRPNAPMPHILQISPREDQILPVLTFIKLTFDRPMTLDNGLPYLRKTELGMDLPMLVSDVAYDATACQFTVPVVLPPDNETKLVLEGFCSADGIASDPVAIRCNIGTNNYSHNELDDISTAAQDPRLVQLLTSIQAARARYQSGIETVQWIMANRTKSAFSWLSGHPALFRWQGTNQFYEDISGFMNVKAFTLGTDGKTCWLYSHSQDYPSYLNSSPVASVEINIGIADPFDLTRRTVKSAIANKKLIYGGQSQLNGRTCYRIESWLVRQTGNDDIPVEANRYEWWIDADTFLPSQLVEGSSSQIWTFRYENLNQPLSDSAFQPPVESGSSPLPEDWYSKNLGPGEVRFLTIKDGSDGSMIGQMGRHGPNGMTSSGMN